jgi:alkyl hydroperoxide reductase subunit F
MLDPNLKQQLSAAMGYLKTPIELTAHLDDSEGSEQVRVLLAELAESSAQISVRAVEASGSSDPGARTPSFGVGRPGQEPRVSFAGLPLGHEFTSLVLAILHVGGHPPKVREQLLSSIEKLEGEFRFETYFSQSCQNCPDLVQALNLLAARNRGVSHVAIDGAFFQAEVEERQVMAVPTVFLNGKPFGQGRMELEELIEKLDTSAGERRAEELGKRRCSIG